MSEPITITATVAAWVYDSEYNGLNAVLSHVENGKHQAAISAMAFYGDPQKQTSFGDHFRVGEADITVRLISRDEQTTLALKALNDKLDKLRAAYLTKQQEILEQISKLQAITYEAA